MLIKFYALNVFPVNYNLQRLSCVSISLRQLLPVPSLHRLFLSFFPILPLPSHSVNSDHSAHPVWAGAGEDPGAGPDGEHVSPPSDLPLIQLMASLTLMYTPGNFLSDISFYFRCF